MNHSLKKLFLITFVVLLQLQYIYSQPAINKNEAEKKEQFIRPYLNLGIQTTLNLASKESSAPSPINFYAGGGTIILINNLISLEPHLDFWSMYYLYDGTDALPAEVEHRTATTLCFMLDIPVGFNFKISRHTITPGCGLGFLMRFCFLANGVKENDAGKTGTAKGDVVEIQKWFWQNGRFLYPEIFCSWDYKINEKLKAGLVAKVYFPIGSFVSGKGFDGIIFNLTSRFVF